MNVIGPVELEKLDATSQRVRAERFLPVRQPSLDGSLPDVIPTSSPERKQTCFYVRGLARGAHFPPFGVCGRVLGNRRAASARCLASIPHRVTVEGMHRAPLACGLTLALVVCGARLLHPVAPGAGGARLRAPRDLTICRGLLTILFAAGPSPHLQTTPG